MGFLRVQRTFSVHSMLLLGGLRDAPGKLDIMTLNLDCNITLVLQATCTVIYII